MAVAERVCGKGSLLVGIYFHKSPHFQESQTIKSPFTFLDTHNFLVLSLHLSSHFVPATWKYLGEGGQGGENLQAAKEMLWFTTLASEYIYICIKINKKYKCMYLYIHECMYVFDISIYNLLLCP